MAAPRAIDLGVFNIASVDRIRFTITKDGAVWDLTAGTVTLVFEDPDGNEHTRSMVAENAATGIFYYDTLTTEIDQVGSWKLGLRVVDGSVTKRYPGAIGFYAVDQP